MPHDVIMPALGMAQDTGKIVRWLKTSGEPVSSGEAIMEVETDKAVMEVEATADGFLSAVSAGDGDDVPVGSVVAEIVASEDEVERAKPAEDAGGERAPSASEADEESLPEGAEIIMPALGMAQDTGLIVSWCKQTGDKVSASDILLEVETDKSVMEVEAGHDGYVAAILADADEAVPVGSVIAVISAEKPENPMRRSAKAAKPASAPQPFAVAEAERTAPDDSKAPKKPKTPARPVASVEGRILASPKARWIAHEQGLDLTRLAEEGVAQPYHVSDLETLRALGVRPEASAVASPARVPLRIEAQVAASGFSSLLDWLQAETGDAPSPSRVWLSFATAALRGVLTSENTVVVGIEKPGGSPARFADADHLRVGALDEEAEDGDADIILRDLTGSSVIRATARAAAAPVLTIGRDRDAFVIGFDYHDSQLDEAAALAFVTGFAGRLEEPLRHLL